MVAPQPPYQTPYSSIGQPPGQPAQPIVPGDICTIVILQLIAGILYLLSFLSVVLFSCGFALFAVTPVFGAIVASLEVYNGARALGREPDPGGFWWRTLPILGIVSIISGDVFSSIAGVVALVLLSKPEVRAWVR